MDLQRSALSRFLRATSVLTFALVVASVPLTAQTRSEATAKRLFDARTPAADAASQLKSTFRAGDAEVVRLLDYAGYRAPAIAQAATRALRATAAQTVVHMSRAGIETPNIAVALNQGLRITGRRALELLLNARITDVLTAEVYRTVEASPAEITGLLRARGEPSTRAARDITESHRLEAREVTRHLMAEYPVVDVGRALKDNFQMDAAGIRSFLEDEGVTIDVSEAALLELGFEPEVPSPLVDYWFTYDWRLGAAPGAIIESSPRIVNRKAVLPSPADNDGVLWFHGSNIDRPETEVWGATAEGTPVQGVIRSREQVGFQERLEVFFSSFPGKGIRLTTDGGTLEATGVAGVAYAPLELSLFEEGLAGLSLEIVDGELSVGFQDLLITGTLGEQQENGVELMITDLKNDGFTVSTEPYPDGLALVLTLPFDEAGREFEGEYFGYIPCWKCLTTTVPKADCPTITVSCLVDFLGQAFYNMGECTDLTKWHESEVMDTEGVSFEGDLINASLEISIPVAVGPNGMYPGIAEFDFSTEVSISTLGTTIDERVVNDYVSTRVTDTLNLSMGDISLSMSLISALRQYASVLGWGRWLSLDRMPDGRGYVVFDASGGG